MSKLEVRAAPGIDLGVAIEHARAAVGTAEQVEHLKGQLALRLAAAGGGSAPASVGSRLVQPKAVVSLVKACLLSAVIGAAGTMAWVATHEPASRGAPAARTPVPASSQDAERSAPAPVGDSPHSAGVDEANESSSSSAGRSDMVNSAPQATHNRAAGRLGRSSAARMTARDSRRLPSAEGPAATHPSEVELISRAQALLDSHPLAALEALHEHEATYASGMLREERDVLRIDAEWALGRHDAALTHARIFLQRYPRSTQARRIETLLREHKNGREAKPTE